jgi:N6-L-threonylcarbamoyladenine synthase
MIVLAVETSCDDTSCAVIGDNYKLLSSIVSSQNLIHQKFGGVVPEIASRHHLENISPVFHQALHDAYVSKANIDGICVTLGPGLIGSLLVGIMFAKGLAVSMNKPFFGVNHIEGHFFASLLGESKPDFPFIALVASGGHTSLYLVNGMRKYKRLGQTRDDAAGECFDKVAKLLNLGYPGGPAIQNTAGETEGTIPLPKPMEREDDFSFSGLKTHVLNITKKHGSLSPEFVKDMAASFQKTVVEILTEKTINSAINNGVSRIVIAGGVSANNLLRKTIQKKASKHGIKVFMPSMELCTDNAAMIGAVGHYFLSEGIITPLSASAIPDWLL